MEKPKRGVLISFSSEDDSDSDTNVVRIGYDEPVDTELIPSEDETAPTQTPRSPKTKKKPKKKVVPTKTEPIKETKIDTKNNTDEKSKNGKIPASPLINGYYHSGSSDSFYSDSDQEEQILLKKFSNKPKNAVRVPSSPSMGHSNNKMLRLLSALERVPPTTHIEYDEDYNPTQLSSSEPILEGFLYKRRRRWIGEWKKFFCVLRKNEYDQHCIYYYRSDKADRRISFKKKNKLKSLTHVPSTGASEARGLIKICWMSKCPFTRKEKEGIALHFDKKQRDISSHYLRIYSPGRMFFLTAQTEDELSRWEISLTTLLNLSLGDEEYKHRQEVSAELEPLLQSKCHTELSRAHDMLKVLETNGFFDNVILKKDKQGTLSLQSDHLDGNWKEYYFLLNGKYLHYYPAGQKEKRNVILLRYSYLTYDKEKDDKIFEIKTPMSTYRLKAKHSVAVEEWMESIERVKFNPESKGDKIKKTLFGTTGTFSEPDTGELNKDLDFSEGIDPVMDKPYFTYTPVGCKKPKTYKMKTGSLKIGRSSSCNIVLPNDSKVSREHARIDTVNGRLVFLDLGSKRGSKLNHHVVKGRQVLRAGDCFKIGNTEFIIHVGY